MIDILMATFNGESYIEEQIESIIRQTYKDWILYIRDDGSEDNTIGIIKKYVKKYSGKIVFIEDNKKGLGAKLNFAELMKYTKSDYCMFADQDDIWIQNKIEITFNKIKQLEMIHGKNLPILVHTDLKVVDQNLKIINNSFWKYQNLNPNKQSLNNIIVQNNITGCTMLMNKKLIELSLDIPRESIMHDWWIGLIATGLGIVDFIEESTILYRQHGKNTVGAHSYNSFKFIINKIYRFKSTIESVYKSLDQAKYFNDRFESQLGIEKSELVKSFAKLKEYNIIKRKRILIKNKFFKNGKLRNIIYFTTI